MSHRTYGQTCALARALDVLGERWTLLIIRDLLVAPRRYTDLHAGLPGIGTNLLADRLAHLESLGLVERTSLPAPAVTVKIYRLTPAGHALEPVVHQLVRWAWRHLPIPSRQRMSISDPLWTVLSLRARFDPAAAEGVTARYEFHVDHTVFYAAIDQNTIDSGLGPIADPTLVFTTDSRTLARLGNGTLDLRQALQSGKVRIKGRRGDIDTMRRLFPLPT